MGTISYVLQDKQPGGYKVKSKCFALSAIFSLSLAAITARGVEVKIGTGYVHADGCNSTSQTFSISIPNADHLDTSFKGVLGGIKVIETTGNGPDHGYSNFAFVANGTALTYELHAKGSGNWIAPIHTPFGNIGGGVCAGAAGGWEGIDIFAEYK